MKRVFLIVLDSFGIGAAPDASDFGDAGANTLRSVKNTGLLNIPTLTAMGIGNIDGVDSVEAVSCPTATVAALREASRGKDTTTGHWEIMGLVSKSAMPTYPDGFPSEVLEEFTRVTGYGVLCNKPYSGTEVIRDYGREHLESGKLIVYTSADSVFQIAAHEDKVPLEELYEICRRARKILVGKHGVGRVIARPFRDRDGEFYRTANRRDFSLVPPERTALDKLKDAGLDTIGVGKIGDIFAMAGISESHPTHSNAEGMQVTEEIAKRDFHGLCFVNLVDFDMNYGHRQDAPGYARALNEFDLWLSHFIDTLGEDDVLMITADHGCDPSDDSTDHTRELVPWLTYSKNASSKNLGTLDGFYRISDEICKLLLT